MHTATTRLFSCSYSLKPIKLNSTTTQFSLYPLNHYSFPQTPINLYGQSVSVCENALEGKIRIFNAVKNDESLWEVYEEELVSVELEAIGSESQFDRVVAEAQQLEESVIIIWMASWCRKCIYLKPKLEKLAADYYPRLRFYCVDVNKVPHKLVAQAGVTKMPTIQLWKDCRKQAEVIGGHKAHLVINEVREMIENECSMQTALG